MRLVGVFGTPCAPLYTGIVEVFHDDEWGALCLEAFPADTLVADTVCRQLGFQHGSPSDPRAARVDPEPTDDGIAYGSDYQFRPEESQRPQERFWLTEVSCRGPEERLVDCDLGPGFVQDGDSCAADKGGGLSRRLHVACRQFAVEEALEAVTSPGAGVRQALRSLSFRPLT